MELRIKNFNTPEGRKVFKKAVFSCWLGTAMEYADFALYGLAAATIFSEVFFPEQTPVIALLLSFVTYGIGFIARPIGALFFGYLGDKHGRKNVMMATIALMGISTFYSKLCSDWCLGAYLFGCITFYAGFWRRS